MATTSKQSGRVVIVRHALYQNPDYSDPFKRAANPNIPQYLNTPPANNQMWALAPIQTELKAVEDPWNKVYYSEAPLPKNLIPQGYTNKVQDQMLASFDQYGDRWNQYFEASYKNPRITEEQRQNTKTKTDQYNARVQEANNVAQLVSANQLEIQAPRQVGTGISAGRDTSINALLTNGGTGLGV